MPKKSIVQTLGKTILASGVEYAIIQYHLLKSHKYAEYDFGEEVLNELGYQLLYINRYKDALKIFKLNVAEYPQAFNPYDSLGEAYMIVGIKSLALKYYKKSLELNPQNINAVQMIEQMNQIN
jgi:tetratricopeptide (TPR) repeat protein